ncbi:FAD-dependent oxidoreductase [Patescibacteria group bacterium]|nr:FAD-dependent oxidoreductase [Patescibacteria group bacterium]
MTRFLIIGGGIAGTTAAEEIRKQDPKSEITIIEQEQHPCYSRVLLPHYITGKVIRDRVFIKKPDWYKEQKIELQAGVRAVEIDVENMHVRTSQERELPYDKLLITSGGELNLIPDDKRGLSYLRTIDDADHLLQLLGELEALPKKERQAGMSSC